MVWAEIIHLTRASVLIQSKRGTAALQQSGLGFGPDSLVIQKEAEDASATVSLLFSWVPFYSIAFHSVLFHCVLFCSILLCPALVSSLLVSSSLCFWVGLSYNFSVILILFTYLSFLLYFTHLPFSCLFFFISSFLSYCSLVSSLPVFLLILSQHNSFSLFLSSCFIYFTPFFTLLFSPLVFPELLVACFFSASPLFFFSHLVSFPLLFSYPVSSPFFFCPLFCFPFSFSHFISPQLFARFFLSYNLYVSAWLIFSSVSLSSLFFFSRHFSLFLFSLLSFLNHCLIVSSQPHQSHLITIFSYPLFFSLFCSVSVFLLWSLINSTCLV